jgi:thioredoxin-related protein
MRALLFAMSFFVLGSADAHSAETAHLYDPKANAEKDVAAAVKKANAEHKFVLVEAGCNWCSWCLRFNKTITEDTQLDSVLNTNFIVYHLNNSAENMNRDEFARLSYPQRFGFPVFLVLDGKGKLIHTQNSEYLEEG